MQLMPFTARRFGVTDSFDPRQNIFGGAQYLRFLLDMFQGDVALALAGYNAGENAVARFKGIPPFKETRDYVQKIQDLLGGGFRTRFGHVDATARQRGRSLRPSSAVAPRAAPRPRRPRSLPAAARRSTTSGTTRRGSSTSPRRRPADGVAYSTIRALD